MNPLTRYEPLVGRLDGLFDEFFRPALRLGETTPSRADPRRREARPPEAYTVPPSCPA